MSIFCKFINGKWCAISLSGEVISEDEELTPEEAKEKLRGLKITKKEAKEIARMAREIVEELKNANQEG